jgi:hypothetical protein
MSFQQVADAPDDFKYSLKVTTTTADASVDAADYNLVVQRIEGTSVYDLNYGTSAAKTTTLSFYVKSSLTGTFGGSFRNNGGDRSYPFTYTISSANTWERKTITIAGDTTGTWVTDTGMGLQVNFGLGVGTTYTGTAGAWVGAGNFSADSSVNVISTLNATWQVTGVQLEVGDTATEFERRPYGMELQLCSRYFWRQYNAGQNVLYDRVYWNGSGNNAIFNLPAPAGMRIVNATVTCSPTTNGTGVSFTHQQYGNIIVYRITAAGDNYFYADDISISAEL